MRRDKEGQPLELVGSWADISDRKKVETELKRMADQVDVRNRFIRETFGRYLTDEVVTTLLESPSGLKMGGEKRRLTMLMSDLRGFTSLSERQPPDRVVALLNHYFATMVKVIKQYEGTIDEFTAMIFVLFGVPTWGRRCRARWPCVVAITGDAKCQRICPPEDRLRWRWASVSIRAVIVGNIARLSG